MGLFQFVKEAGSKLLGSDEAEAALLNSDTATPERLNAVKKMKIEEAIAASELPVISLEVAVNADQVVLSGEVSSQELAEKLTLIAGNQQGIAAVECQLTVKTLDPQSSTAIASIYQVKAGDTLGGIADAHYGDANQYMKIFEANTPMLSDPDKIYVGQSLRIPAA